MPLSSSSPPTAGPATLGWDDHRPFVGSPASHPLDRLVRVRADGTLEPVPKGSLTGVPRIYCAVHGWAPGSQAAADLIRAQTGADARAWDEGMVDLFGFRILDSFMPLLTAVAARDPQAAVLWFSWIDDSATEGQVFASRHSLERTHINGARLAMALVAASSARLPPLHLIGHSHGCVVASHAALALPEAPAQLTLLDCPEDWFSRVGGAAGLLAEVLPRLEPGRSAGRVFIDSYTAMFGRWYHRFPGLSEVVDVGLVGALRHRDSRGAVGDAHEYALEWYAQTAGSDAAQSGFGWSVLAAARDGTAFDPVALDAGYVVRGDRRPVAVARRPATPALPQYEEISLGVGEIVLTPDRPDVLVGVTLSGVDLVEFDYQISDPAPHSRVQGAVGRILAFSGASGEYQVPSWGCYLRVPGGRDTSVPLMLQFRLADPAAGTSATIRGLRGVRTGVRTHNYDVTGTAVAIALVGAVAGAAATLAVQAMARSLRNRGAGG
jgi:hypothetical protein